jgi:SsrA-binding protein
MRVINRKARFKYQILEEYEAGIILTGEEVKVARLGKMNISQAFAKPVEGEIYLINANIPVSTNPTQSRKLLLHKKEIGAILAQIKAKKLTLVPLSVYTKHNLVKVKLGLGKAKKQFEKRDLIKKRDLEREMGTYRIRRKAL